MSESRDYIVRATAANHQIRAFAATTKDMVECARTSHNTSPVATAALGRLLTAGAMMGAMQKNEQDVLTLKIKAGGPINGITVTADAKGNVKGYVGNPQVMLPPNSKGKLDVAGAVGVGLLQVIKDMGLKEPYVGQTILTTSEIAEDLTYYFATSEQVPSSVGLGVLMEKDNTVKRAGGFIIQLLPFTDDETIEKLEKNLSDVTSVTEMLEQGMTPEGILAHILDGLDMVVTDRLDTSFACDCSENKIEKMLISLGREEMQAMIEDGETIEVNCHFCGKKYHVSVERLKELLSEAVK